MHIFITIDCVTQYVEGHDVYDLEKLFNPMVRLFKYTPEPWLLMLLMECLSISYIYVPGSYLLSFYIYFVRKNYLTEKILEIIFHQFNYWVYHFFL